jgi:hypothetical protein
MMEVVPSPAGGGGPAFKLQARDSSDSDLQSKDAAPGRPRACARPGSVAVVPGARDPCNCRSPGAGGHRAGHWHKSVQDHAAMMMMMMMIIPKCSSCDLDGRHHDHHHWHDSDVSLGGRALHGGLPLAAGRLGALTPGQRL